MSNIRLFKLVTGEEMIAKVVKEDNNRWNVESPRVLVAQPTGNGQMGIAMIPWIVGAPDCTTTLSEKDIVGTPISNLSKQLEDGYLSQTSGIALAGV